MTWLLAIAVGLIAIAAWLAFAFWLGRLVADAQAFMERDCTCRKGARCAACLAASEAIRPKPGRAA